MQYGCDTELLLAHFEVYEDHLWTKQSHYHYLEHCLFNIKEWSTQNDLKLNSDNTEVIHVKSSILDSGLDMQYHVGNKCKSTAMGLHKIRKYLDRGTTAWKLVHAFITCHLDNNNGLLYGIPDTLLRRMQYIQNSAARLITKKRKFDPISPILQDLHWLPIKSRIKFKLLTMVFRCIQRSAPVYLQEIIQSYKITCSIIWRHQQFCLKGRVRIIVNIDIMSQNVQQSGPYIKYSAEKREPWWNWRSPELEYFLHLKRSSFKKNGAPRRYVVIWNNSKNPTGWRTRGCEEDFGISQTFWTLRHCPGAVWKPDVLFKSPQPPCTPCQIWFLNMHFYREENAEPFEPLPPPPPLPYSLSWCQTS